MKSTASSKYRVETFDFSRGKNVSRVAGVYARAFSGEPWHEHWTPAQAARELKSWRKLNKRFAGRVFIVRHVTSGEIVGLAVGHWHDPTNTPKPGQPEDSGTHLPDVTRKLGPGRHYYLREIAVHPDHQRQGVGRLLMDALEHHAHELGADDAFSRTRYDDAPQIKQFERFQYTPFHAQDATIGGVSATNVYYRKTLTNAP